MAESSDKMTEKELRKKYGHKYEKMKMERDSSIFHHVAAGFGAYPGLPSYG